MGKIREGEVFTLTDDSDEGHEVEVLGSLDVEGTEYVAVGLLEDIEEDTDEDIDIFFSGSKAKVNCSISNRMKNSKRYHWRLKRHLKRKNDKIKDGTMCRLFICIRKVSAPPSPNTMIATRAIQPYLSIGLYY